MTERSGSAGGTERSGSAGGTERSRSALGLDRSADDSDTGWGDRPAEDDDDRLRREVPPHW